MRLGLVLRGDVVTGAVEAESLGFDLVWVDRRETPAPFVAAAAIGAATRGVRVVSSCAAGVHPLRLAEDFSVADLSTGGRSILVLAGDDVDLVAETLDVLFAALAARPFSHRGRRWQIPAHLPEHHDVEQRVRMTPPPAQLEPSVWLEGRAAPILAGRYGLALVDGDAGSWDAVCRSLGPAAMRLRRVGVYPVGGDLDLLTAELQAARESFGLDVAVLDVPAASDRRRTIAAIAREVRPRLQLDRLPEGLDAHWRARPA